MISPFDALEDREGSLGFVRTDSRSGSDSKLFQKSFSRLAFKRQMDSGPETRGQEN